MELRYRKEAAVGLLIIIGAAVFVFLMMWLKGRSFGEGLVVQAHFPDVAGLKVGDPVRTSGVTVGSVDRIELQGAGQVAVWFDVDDGQPPRTDATVRIIAADFFGARIVDYDPGRSDSMLPPDRVLRGARVEDMTEMAAGMGGQARQLLDNANAVTTDLRAVLREASRLVATLDRGAAGSSRELEGALENLRTLLHRVDLVVRQNEAAAAGAMTGIASTTANVDRMTRSLEQTAASMDSLVTRINRGEGAIGQLLTDTALVNELRTTNRAMRDLLVDFRENPGRYIRLRLF